MTDKELLDKFAFELMRLGFEKNNILYVHDAYKIAEEMVMKRKQVLDKWELKKSKSDGNIEKLGLPGNAYNCLKKDGIHTIDQLQNCTSNTLRKIPNFGAKSIRETIQKLDEIGLKLKESNEPK